MVWLHPTCFKAGDPPFPEELTSWASAESPGERDKRQEEGQLAGRPKQLAHGASSPEGSGELGACRLLTCSCAFRTPEAQTSTTAWKRALVWKPVPSLPICKLRLQQHSPHKDVVKNLQEVHTGLSADTLIWSCSLAESLACSCTEMAINRQVLGHVSQKLFADSLPKQKSLVLSALGRWDFVIRVPAVQIDSWVYVTGWWIDTPSQYQW